MRFGIDFPNCGEFADARELADLARLAEDAGWDGCFLWDHLRIGDTPIVDPWVALTAMALATRRILLGPLVSPLYRYSPFALARATVTLDRLSAGRLIFGAGLGSDYFGEISLVDGPRDDRARVSLLDESLAIITGLWRDDRFSFAGKHYHIGEVSFSPKPWREGIPIWIAAGAKAQGPICRAARYAGIVAVGGDFCREITPAETLKLTNNLAQFRSLTNFDIVHLGSPAAASHDIISAYEAVGVTWWLAALLPSDSIAEIRHFISNGPPK